MPPVIRSRVNLPADDVLIPVLVVFIGLPTLALVVYAIYISSTSDDPRLPRARREIWRLSARGGGLSRYASPWFRFFSTSHPHDTTILVRERPSRYRTSHRRMARYPGVWGGRRLALGRGLAGAIGSEDAFGGLSGTSSDDLDIPGPPGAFTRGQHLATPVGAGPWSGQWGGQGMHGGPGRWMPDMMGGGLDPHPYPRRRSRRSSWLPENGVLQHPLAHGSWPVDHYADVGYRSRDKLEPFVNALGPSAGIEQYPRDGFHRDLLDRRRAPHGDHYDGLPFRSHLRGGSLDRGYFGGGHRRRPKRGRAFSTDSGSSRGGRGGRGHLGGLDDFSMSSGIMSDNFGGGEY